MVGSTSRSLLRCKAVLGSAEVMLRPWTPRMTSTQGQDASAVTTERGREGRGKRREGEGGGVRGERREET